MFYTAIGGAAVRIGLRQSIPSSSIDSCARLNETIPLPACGQMKRPRSSRLANKQSVTVRRRNNSTRVRPANERLLHNLP